MTQNLAEDKRARRQARIPGDKQASANICITGEKSVAPGLVSPVTAEAVPAEAAPAEAAPAEAAPAEAAPAVGPSRHPTRAHFIHG